MYKLKLVPDNTSLQFLKLRRAAYALSILAAVASIGLFFGRGLNYGIDFRGGILLEIGAQGQTDLAAMRRSLGDLALGEIAVQSFGSDSEALIRIERQPGDSTAQQKAVELVKARFLRDFGDIYSYRRVEFVGPKVSAELVEAGTLAVILAVIAMLAYIWFRFEWHFSVGAVIALLHDVILTIGMFSLTGLEFNLSIIAAILTIVGYSMNDTVVVYDRVRENLRKFKRMALPDLLDLSINDTLSRTVMTSVTTLLALVALMLFGGEVIRGFTAAMIWGIFVGTYSSIFIAAPILIPLGLRGDRGDIDGNASAGGNVDIEA